MGQYQRLFLIADPAMRHSQALQRAAALAEASGAALHITAFVEPFATFALLEKSVREQIREDHLREHREWLADEAGLLRSKGLQGDHRGGLDQPNAQGDPPACVGNATGPVDQGCAA